MGTKKQEWPRQRDAHRFALAALLNWNASERSLDVHAAASEVSECSVQVLSSFALLHFFLATQSREAHDLAAEERGVTHHPAHDGFPHCVARLRKATGSQKWERKQQQGHISAALRGLAHLVAGDAAAHSRRRGARRRGARGAFMGKQRAGSTTLWEFWDHGFPPRHA